MPLCFICITVWCKTLFPVEQNIWLGCNWGITQGRPFSCFVSCFSNFFHGPLISGFIPYCLLLPVWPSSRCRPHHVWDWEERKRLSFLRRTMHQPWQQSDHEENLKYISSLCSVDRIPGNRYQVKQMTRLFSLFLTHSVFWQVTRMRSGKSMSWSITNVNVSGWPLSLSLPKTILRKKSWRETSVSCKWQTKLYFVKAEAACHSQLLVFVTAQHISYGRPKKFSLWPALHAIIQILLALI